MCCAALFAAQITPHYFIGAWPSEEALVPTVRPAVLDVTCELPLQVALPADAYLTLPVWDTHGKAGQPAAQVNPAALGPSGPAGPAYAHSGRAQLAHCSDDNQLLGRLSFMGPTHKTTVHRPPGCAPGACRS